ncbi:MAG: MFS transporter [Acidimicrobiales bacterium]
MDLAGDVSAADRDSVQRRTVPVLLSSQAAGGVGVVATYIVSALLAKDITGSPVLATIAAACLSIGGALAAYPLAALMNSKGRRVGLRTAYLFGTAGGMLAVTGAITRSYPLLCIGIFGAGAGQAGNLATRYAASDLAREERRAFTISMVVWATTVGSATGAAVSGVASDIGETFGLPDKASSYLLAALMFLVAGAIVEAKLRPDPLLVAGGLGKTSQKGAGLDQVKKAFKLIWANPAARLAVGAMIIVQSTMVGVMALTPLHMDDGGQTQNVIGFMMMFHILGMYLFSPAVGWLTDRVGQYPMLYVAGILCTAGAGWAAVTPPTGVVGAFMGNFLIGLGWSFGVIAASALIVSQFPIDQRVSVQGAGDLAMVGSGALTGLASGALYAFLGYGGVNAGNAVLGGMLIAGTALTYVMVRRDRDQEPVVAAH